jgi:hypothetical protein
MTTLVGELAKFGGPSVVLAALLSAEICVGRYLHEAQASVK